MIGQKLLHYEVTAKLGEGGMGEVYRATDSKLGREVAIKVLPAAFTEDEERLARFEREARVLAALEHPNIAGIYGLEEAEGQQFLVMQLASGEDLATHLKRGPLSLEAALPIAAQIAQALEAAHDGGIVHRDLKPANIMVGPDRSVKVLDFGLAKAWDGGGSDVNLTASPTLTAQMTQVGVILGTAGYMSPEQARGQEADRRADIWSFGVVLHEMLTGGRLFAADTVSDTLARVLMAEPEWDEIDKSLPAPISRLLRRCLERDVARRLQAIGEARIAIEDYLADPHPQTSPEGEATTEPGTSAKTRWTFAALGVALGAVAGWVLVSALSGPTVTKAGGETMRFAIRPPGAGAFIAEDVHALAISPDGGTVAFVASLPDEPRASIYIKTADRAVATVVPNTEGAGNPFFSPDGQSLGFFDETGLRRVNLRDAGSIQLAVTADRRGAAWHADGTIYYVPHSDGPVLRVSERGVGGSPVTTLDVERLERTHRWPALLPGDRGLIYTSDTLESSEFYDDARIEWVDPATGATKVLLEGSSRAVYSLTGHLVFARDGSIWAVPFDLDTLEVTGEPVLAVQNVSTTVASGAVQFALADNGTLAYMPGGKTAEVFDLLWLSEADEATFTASTWVRAGVEVIVEEMGQFLQLALSPEEDLVALVENSQGATLDIWVYDLERDSRNRLTFEGGNTNPTWSSDGQSIFFSSDRSGQTSIYLKRADGRGDAQLIWEAASDAVPIEVTRDGRYLLASLKAHVANSEGRELWLIDLEGTSEPTKLFDLSVAAGYASISPDGNWLAYSSRETGQSRIYVVPFPEGSGKWQISTITSREPRWSSDGSRVLYRTAEGFKYVEVDLSDGFRASEPRTLTRGNVMSPFSHTYSLSPDGKRVLALLPTDLDTNRAIHVVLNWGAELERLMENQN